MRPVALIAAGGTGGHIYPALAVAKALRDIQPELEIRFVGTAEGLEQKLIPREGFPLHALSIGRLNRNVAAFERISTVLKLPLSLLQSVWLTVRFRPVFVLGVGGHASGPLLLMASLLRRRTLIWEPNAIPGLANRILSRFVGTSLVVFEAAKKHLKCKDVRVVGMPVREEIENLFGLEKKFAPPLRILVFGGSQGARDLNSVVAETFRDSRWHGQVELVHQTGAGDFERIKKLYEPLPAWVQVFEYLYDMDKRYCAADLVIARSGTGTLSELAAAKKPAILIPLPTAADNHQQKNAEVFATAKAAILILQKDLTKAALTDHIERLLNTPNDLHSMSMAVEKFFTPHAAHQVAQIILGG